MAVLSVDPGEVTGLAFRLGDRLVVSMAKEREEVWRVAAGLHRGDEVVVEDFVTAGRISKHGLFTVRLVGALEALCWDRGVRMTKQVPMYRVSCLARAAEMLPRGSKYEHRHEKDALAHLLAYERDKGVGNGRSGGRTVGHGTYEAVRAPVQELCEYSSRLVRDFGD